MAIFAKGIDISSYQGSPDFKKVKEAGYSFVIVRGGFFNQTSKSFVPQLEAAQAAGLDTGVYWYSYAVNPQEAQQEADACLKTIKNYQFTYPIWFDQEYEPRIQALTKEQRTNICKTFLEALKKEGYYVGLYASKDWLENWVDSSQLEGYDKWVAQYADKITYQGSYTIWQYTGKGQVPGIQGDVDLNIAYKAYPQIVKELGLNGWNTQKPDYQALYQQALSQLKEAQERLEAIRKAGGWN